MANFFDQFDEPTAPPSAAKPVEQPASGNFFDQFDEQPYQAITEPTQGGTGGAPAPGLSAGQPATRPLDPNGKPLAADTPTGQPAAPDIRDDPYTKAWKIIDGQEYTRHQNGTIYKVTRDAQGGLLETTPIVDENISRALGGKGGSQKGQNNAELANWAEQQVTPGFMDYLKEFKTGPAQGAISTTGTMLKGFSDIGLAKDEQNLIGVLSELDNAGSWSDQQTVDYIRRAMNAAQGSKALQMNIPRAVAAIRSGQARNAAEVDGFGDLVSGALMDPRETQAFKIGQKLQDYASANFKGDPRLEGSFYRDVLVGTGSLAPFIAVSVLPGGSAISTAAGIGAGKGEALDNAIAALDAGKPVSREQMLNAVGLGGIPGATEQIPIETLLERIPLPGGKVLGVVGRVARQALAEGGQEGLQQFLQNVIQNYVYDPEKGLTEDVLRNAAVGAAVGGGLQTAVEGGKAVVNRGGKQDMEGPQKADSFGQKRIGQTVNVDAKGNAQTGFETIAPEALPGQKERAPLRKVQAEAILQQQGYSPQEVADMSAEELRAEAQAAIEAGAPIPTETAGTRRDPVAVQTPQDVEIAAQQIAPEPTDGQKAAGNYKHAHIQFQGLDIALETGKGQWRTGVDEDGERWETQMPAHYGRIKRTEGADGDQVDVYIGDATDSDRVFIVNQINPETLEFDEHKAILGTNSQQEAASLYAAGFSDGTGQYRNGGMREMSVAEFKDWLKGDTKAPVSTVPAPGAAPMAPPRQGGTSGPASLDVAAPQVPVAGVDQQQQPGGADGVQPGAQVGVGANLPDAGGTAQVQAAGRPAPEFYKPFQTYLKSGKQLDPDKIAAAIGSDRNTATTLLQDAARDGAVTYSSKTGKFRRASKDKRPADLMTWIARNGGIQNQQGDMNALTGGKNPFIAGAGPLVRAGGKLPDMVREAAIEAGYLPEGASIRDLYDAIDRNMRGERVVSEFDADWEQETQAQAEQERLNARFSSPEIRSIVQQYGEDFATAIESYADEAGISLAKLHDTDVARAAELFGGGMDIDNAMERAPIEYMEGGEYAAGHYDLTDADLIEQRPSRRTAVPGFDEEPANATASRTPESGQEAAQAGERRPDGGSQGGIQQEGGNRADAGQDGTPQPEEAAGVTPAEVEATRPNNAFDRFIEGAKARGIVGDYETNPTMDAAKVFPKLKGKVVKAADVAGEVMDPAAANARVKEWKAFAKAQGDTMQNSNRVILSLFDYTGNWSKPFVDAGFTVVQYDIELVRDDPNYDAGDERFAELLSRMPTADIQALRGAGFEIYGVLSACPCTTFAASGARWWEGLHNLKSREAIEKVFGPWVPEGFESPFEYNKALVNATELVIELANPTGFHVLENPVGRIGTSTGLGDPQYRFDPHHFGDPYTKKTQLWGDFSTDLPTANVDPSEGSKMHMKSSKDRSRSDTPLGFSYAFFMANNPAVRKPSRVVEDRSEMDPDKLAAREEYYRVEDGMELDGKVVQRKDLLEGGPKPATETGADGRPQLVMPGMESDPAGAAQNAADKPLKPKVDQKPADEGLFGDTKDQADIADAGKGLPLFRDTSKPAPFRKGMLEQDRERMQGALNDIAKRILGRNMKPVKLETSLPSGQWGAYNAMQELVKVSLEAQVDPRTVLRHELIHVMRQHGIITRPEWSVLTRAAKAWRAEYEIDKRYRQVYGETLDLTPAQLDEVLVEEAVAEAFADFWLTRGRQQGPVARIFERLMRLIEEIRNWLVGNGYTSARQIFEGMEQGQMADRLADPTGRGFTLARRRMQERNLFPEEEGADGRPQAVIPGAERVTDKRLAERQAEAPMRSQKPQKELDFGLFDDGKQGELFQIMRAIKNTPAFKRWFGDSKVVDEAGNPRVVYHGTVGDIDEFADVMGRQGSYFAEDPAYANVFAGATGKESPAFGNNVLPVYLSIQNPADLTNPNPSLASEVAAAGYRNVPLLDVDPQDMWELFDGDDKLRVVLQGLGYDGVKLREPDYDGKPYASWLAFEPTQIKSIFNAGEFAADNPNILAMVQRRQRLTRSQRLEAAIRNALASVVGRLKDYGLRARRNLQDRFIYVKRLQEEIARGNPVTEFQNVYQAESLFHGRAADRNDKLMDEVVQPIIKKIASSNLTVEQVDEYLYARHAPERNAVIRERNPDLGDAGSGMTDAEAADVIDGFRRMGKLQAMEAIAADIDAMKEQSLRGMLRDGLISQEQYNDWRSMYQHYVPLRGWEADEDRPTGGPDRPRIGKRFDIRGREAMRAMGRTTKADSPLAYTIMQAQQAIIRGEKNKVLKTFLRLVQANPDPSLWEVNRRIAERYAKDNSKAQMLDPNAPPWVVKERWVVEKDAPDVVSVKIGGQPTYIKVHDQNIAKAMKGLDAVPLHDVTKALHAVNRWLSYMSTAANPPFTISNFFRDLQTAQINLAETEVRGIHKNVARDIIKAGKGVWGGLNGKRDTQWQRYYHEWAAEGGKIGWMNAYDIDNHKKRLDKLLKQANGGNAEAVKAAGRLIKETVENANMTVENAVRLSTYVNLRRAGVSKAKAASVSRELTVNFNRRGEWGAAANALYLFYNAGIQGSVRMFQAMKHPKVRRIVYGIMASSIALDLYNRMFAGDDDDDENHYDKIPFWVKERNLIVMYPDGSGRRLQFPLPWGYNLFHVAGQQASSALFGPEKPMQAAINVVTTAINAFNPLGGADNLTRILTPTFLDPFVDLYSNRDWLGRQIAPDYGAGDKRPDSERYWNSVTGPSKETARFLNEVTGGNEVRPGAIDISPETIDYWFETVFGGAGATAKRTYGMLEKVWSGEAVEMFEIPFLRRLYGTPSPTLDRQLYYELRDNVDLTKREFELARETGNKELEAEVRARPEFRLIELVKDTENKRRQIRKRIREIEASKLSDEEKAKRRDVLIERLDQVQTLVRKRYNSLIEKQD